MRERNQKQEEKQSIKELESYRIYLEEQEKSPSTVMKYLHDVRLFLHFLEEKKSAAESQREKALSQTSKTCHRKWTAALSQADVISYKKYLQARYAASSVNSMLNALNSFLKFSGRTELRARMLRQQRRLFREEGKVLRRHEYEKLVLAAQREQNERLACILQTICMTGIRVGELRFVTCRCLKSGVLHVEQKGKLRDIPIPKKLASLLLQYCRKRGIGEGQIFVTRSGRALDRKNIWREMKRLCKKAGVDERKVYPHNLRHLFAVSFYAHTNDITRLADYLGHSSLETTRRYTMISTAEACQMELDLGLLVTGHSPKSSGKNDTAQRKKRKRRTKRIPLAAKMNR